MTEEKAVLSLSHITKRYGGVVALQDVDFSVLRGEVHGLVGENGSGKSTLVKIATGVVQPDAGAEIFVEGKRIFRLTPYLAFHLGIHVVHQDLSLFPNLSVAENILVHEYIEEHRRFVSWQDMERRAREVLGRIGVDLDPRMVVGRLSFADQQLVAICRAIASEAKLIILDEPTASLTFREVQRLFGFIRELKTQGIAFVFISHRLDEVLEISDRVTVLRDGMKVGTFPKEELTKARLSFLMTGKEIVTQSRVVPLDSPEEVLRVEHLTRKGEYADVSFSLHRGEILGLIGPRGSGRTEVALTLFGLTAPDSGKIILGGREVRFRSNRDAIRHGIGYVPENRLLQGLVLDQPVSDNIAVTILDSLVERLGFLHPAKKFSVAEKAVLDFGIKVPAVDAPVRSLSGGNQQKVVLSRWILTAPRILILDTPTHGVDVAAKESIYEMILALARDRGIGILLISDEEHEVLQVCHRILVMKEGRIIREYVPSAVTEEALRREIVG
ncbi:MAG: sugar ABC transporter ATP-binding protein [Candidatus Caldatribacterium sp.]|uniref:sugar ABC transporter ATP-binding protein n=1 Tax=Candidatus Caldatribacterium sp. TaxID=2282143 RepID=UPI00299B90C8|nr:sugar ABC transporter ATP-binding protein [Candidatus Caldatribacterium sp.]MCX7729726.1 sugar ABC transporter ATP-binding protein [Candidatus Caldatribacterium sp.]MDW8081353.1 sugar ABC transporter ATP-binding protein [Candidatus Calescibacterium sp.]